MWLCICRPQPDPPPTVPVLPPSACPTTPRPAPLFKSKVSGPAFLAKGSGSVPFPHLHLECVPYAWKSHPDSLTDHTHPAEGSLGATGILPRPLQPTVTSRPPTHSGYCLPQSLRRESLLLGTPPARVCSSTVRLFLCSLPPAATTLKEGTGLPTSAPSSTHAPSRIQAHSRCSFMYSVVVHWTLKMGQALS